MKKNFPQLKYKSLLDKFPDTKNIHKVTLENKISEVIDEFDKSKLSDLLVVKDDKPLGLLYKADLYSKTAIAKDPIEEYKTGNKKDYPLKQIIENMEPEFIRGKVGYNKWCEEFCKPYTG